MNYVAATDADRAYAAGLVDGEGAIMIPCVHRATGRPQYLLRIEVTNTYFPMLYWLQERWGGTVRSLRQRHPQHKPIMSWIVQARLAGVFLENVRPFLLVKLPQADNAIAFQRTKTGEFARRLSPGDWEQVEGFFQTQRSLNKRGTQ